MADTQRRLLSERADEITDTYLENGTAGTPPEIASLITGDVPTSGGSSAIHGSGVTDTNDEVRLAKRDNARGLR